jgi:hypothetical protein
VKSPRLKTSRINLLARFLRTASPSFREATIPSRAVPDSLGATSTVAYRPFARCDRSNTLWYSSRRLTRRAFENRSDCRGMFRGSVLRAPALRGGNSQALAPFRPAAFQHLAAVLRGHAHEESVRALSAPAVWLERHTHCRIPCNEIKIAAKRK